MTNALPLPFQAASLGFVLAAIVLGIRALFAARRAGLRGLLVSALAIGLAFTSLLLVSIVALLALWPMQLERQQCLQQAQTLAATSGCQADFQRTLDDRLREMRGTGTGT